MEPGGVDEAGVKTPAFLFCENIRIDFDEAGCIDEFIKLGMTGGQIVNRINTKN